MDSGWQLPGSMSSGPTFVILADESAMWQIPGLAQLDRLVLALNEFIDKTVPNAIAQTAIFWKAEISSGRRWLPRHARINRIQLTENVARTLSGAQVLDTHLLVQRDGLRAFFEAISPATVSETAETWEELHEAFQQKCRSQGTGNADVPWVYIESSTDVAVCEKHFLQQTGKSQDGFVSRFFNRLISRSLTRWLLGYDISPNAWTTLILVLPVIAFFFLLRGDYLGFVTGAAMFQLYSVVDGCDGEIARAKYLESSRGAKIDTWSDVLGGFVFAIGLAAGLYRQDFSNPQHWIYLVEAVALVVIVTINELILHSADVEIDVQSHSLGHVLYSRHRQLIEHSGILLLGPKAVSWLVQFTKRDVSVLFFFALAIAGYPHWILPLWIAISAAVLLLGEIARRKMPYSALRTTVEE
jgi:phosphatidylglycerophosphate synthase